DRVVDRETERTTYTGLVDAGEEGPDRVADAPGGFVHEVRQGGDLGPEAHEVVDRDVLRQHQFAQRARLGAAGAWAARAAHLERSGPGRVALARALRGGGRHLHQHWSVHAVDVAGRLAGRHRHHQTRLLVGEVHGRADELAVVGGGE